MVPPLLKINTCGGLQSCMHVHAVAGDSNSLQRTAVIKTYGNFSIGLARELIPYSEINPDKEKIPERGNYCLNYFRFL